MLGGEKGLTSRWLSVELYEIFRELQQSRRANETMRSKFKKRADASQRSGRWR